VLLPNVPISNPEWGYFQTLAIADYQKVSIPRQSRGLYPAKAGLAPQRGLIAIDQNQNRDPFIVQSIAKFLFLSFLRKQESSFFWIPGRVSLARNDNSMFPELSNSGSPPAEPGVYLNANYLDSRLHACALKRYGAQARE